MPIRIEFRAGGNSAEYQRSGWSNAEARHTWTLGSDSAIELPRPSARASYTLGLKLAPFVWGEKLPAQKLVVTVEGAEVGSFSVKKPETLECRLPWKLIGEKDTISVAFHHPDAARPIDISGVQDDRAIAFAFEMVSLVRARKPTQPSDAALAESLPRTNVIAVAIEKRAESGDYRDLMLEFESLGENCEFGLAQRRCGAEPLGLLRFSSTPLWSLMTALDGNFAGLGQPENLEVQISPNGREYMVLDKCYGLLYHPWVLVGEASAEDVHLREAKRLPYLTRKLIEDLTEARKIFVYHGVSALTVDEARRLAAALRRYGRNTLLWVEIEERARPAGTVEPVADGLLKAYIDRFAPSENAHDLSLSVWIDICRKARQARSTR